MGKIRLKSSEEIELIRQSAQLVSRTLGLLAQKIIPGANGLELDRLAEEFIRDHGGLPGFKGMYDFPNTLCISPNDVVVHGVPNDKPFQQGDIVSIDCGVLMNGFYGDHAYTFEVGEVSKEIKHLITTTKESLYKGISAFVHGNRVGDISYAIEQHNKLQGFGIVRDLVGHGLGKELHEEPQVPNYGKMGQGKKLVNGMVLAIEPMINMGTYQVSLGEDKSTIFTDDGKPSAHFEHNVAMVNNKPCLLSTFDYIHEALGIYTPEEAPFN